MEQVIKLGQYAAHAMHIIAMNSRSRSILSPYSTYQILYRSIIADILLCRYNPSQLYIILQTVDTRTQSIFCIISDWHMLNIFCLFQIHCQLFIQSLIIGYKKYDIYNSIETDFSPVHT